MCNGRLFLIVQRIVVVLLELGREMVRFFGAVVRLFEILVLSNIVFRLGLIVFPFVFFYIIFI